MAATSRKNKLVEDDKADMEELKRLEKYATKLFTGQGLAQAQPYHEIQGLAKIRLNPKLRCKLRDIHDFIKTQIRQEQMVPWAGVGQDTKRLRAMAFRNEESLRRLDEAGIRLHAQEKTGQDAIEDERANRKACIVIQDAAWKQKVDEAIPELLEILRAALPTETSSLTMEELIALQPNLHNGAAHLTAHLDWPRHEGFGKAIVTVAVRGGATVVLIGPEDDKAWSFRLNEGECYVLTGPARTNCLHGVLADVTEKGGELHSYRESLNLRFGLHTAEEASTAEWWEDPPTEDDEMGDADG